MDQIKKLPKKHVFLLVFWGLVFVYFILTSSLDEKLEVGIFVVIFGVLSFSISLIMAFIFGRKKR